MDEALPIELIPTAIAVCSFALLFLTLQKAKRTKGRRVEYHVAFFIAALIILLFVPEFVHDIIFNPYSVLIVGTVIPITQSIRSAVSSNAEDDLAWLQFWLASGSFTHLTEWMDVVAEHYPSIAENWYQIEFFTLLWFILPFTDGSSLMFEKITEPCLGDFAKGIKRSMDGKIGYLLIVINSSYLWFAWFTFMTLDEEAKRFIVIAAGTVYPIASTAVVCVTRGDTANDKRDPTFWLTYWSCFSILFIAMDYLENFIGTIRGFYSICLCATIYLFLPMFQGAESIFRNIIVPVSGQYEAMFLRDILIVKSAMVKKIPAAKRERAFEKAAALFTKEK